jgi:hypothetical protein
MQKNEKLLPTITSLYVLSIIFPVILARKLISIPIIGITPASIIFTANYFIILSIITVIYGYKKAQITIFNGLLVHTLFTIVMQINVSMPVITQPVPSIYFGTNNAYSLIFGRSLYTGWFYVLFLLTIFATVNNKIIDMLTIKVPKLNFWIKLLIASGTAIIGMSIVTSIISDYQNASNFSINTYVIEFYKTIIIKIIMLLIFSIPGTLLFSWIRTKEFAIKRV